MTNLTRRNFLGTAALGLVATQANLIEAVHAAPSNAGAGASGAISPASNTFTAIRQLRAGVLDVGYVDAGPRKGTPIVLFHGWPYDIHAFIDVVPMLVAAGYRVVVPHLRGYGSTRFLSPDTLRNGQQASFTADAVAFLDELKIERATFARSARSLDNPDHVAISVSNYRWRLGLAPSEPQYEAIEQRLARFPDVAVPTITMEGEANGAPHPDPKNYAKKFLRKYEHRHLAGGIGHNVPQEAPREFAKAILDVAKWI